MTNQSCPASDCPNIETLSGFIDGEKLSGLEEHLAQCERCGRIVEAYKCIDASIDKQMHVPTGLEARVIEAVRQANASPTPARLFPAFFSTAWRYAAAFVLTAVLCGAMAQMLRNRRGGKANDTLADGSAQEQQPQVMAGQYGRAPLLPEVRLPVTNSAHLATGPVRRVDVTGSQVRNGTQTQVRPVALLPQIVRHVWTVKDLAEAKARLEKLLPADAQCTVQELGKDRFSLNAELPDKQLQELVNAFAQNGWGLVSANLPQPGDGEKVHFLGRKVLYSAELVKVK